MVDQVGPLAGLARAPGISHELIAAQAYDANAALALLAERNIAAVMPSRANRKAPRWPDPGVYGMRHLAANRFAARKEFRGIATQYCKRSLMYGGLLNPVSALVVLRDAVSERPVGGSPAVNRRLAL